VKNFLSNLDKMSLWQILVPTTIDGKPIRTRYHRVWDKKVREICGGLTVFLPVKGQWINPKGNLFVERMIPIWIMCTLEQIEKISDITAKYYVQEAVMFAKITDEVFVRHYDNKVKK
jgi:hypothetical protein